MLGLDVSNLESRETHHSSKSLQSINTENSSSHKYIGTSESTPIFNLTNPEHDRLNAPIRPKRGSRELVIRPHKQIRDQTPILTVNDDFLNWVQEDRHYRASISSVEDNGQLEQTTNTNTFN
jgi:hypothetical protein